MELERLVLEGYRCPCPGSPHKEEWVELEPAITVPMGMAAMYQIAHTPTGNEGDLRALLAPLFMRFGIRAWSFTDVKGGAITVSADSVERLLPFVEAGFEVADRCLDLYLEGIIAPLAARQERLLAHGPKDASTSPTPESGPTPLSQRSPSSRGKAAGSKSEAPAP
jgi:hypothetical protein